MTCKTCKWWDIEAAKDKAGRVRSNRVAQCLWPLPAFPSSFHRDNPSRMYMAHDMGKGCPCWEPRA